MLETDRASVFAVIGGVLHTPPAGGRLLPGVTRAAVLRIAREEGLTVSETPLHIRRLPDASEVFVTNSVQGVVPVRSLAGAIPASPAPAGPVPAGPAPASPAPASPPADSTVATWMAGPVTRRLQAALARRPADAPSPVAGPAPPRWPGRDPRGQASAGRPVIVLIDNYDSFTYNLAHLLLRQGCQVEVVRNDEICAGDVAGLGPDGIVISPGPGTPADAGASIDIVRACAATIPLLGICLGHQAIAAAYGARIIAAPQPVHGQASVITHDGGGVLSGLPRRFPAARYHSLIVEEESLPPGLVITARGPGRIPMGLRHTQHPAEGLQFHPESILTTRGPGIIRNFLRLVTGTPAPARGSRAGFTASASPSA